MLVQFSLKNVMSFKDEVVLDMTAIQSYKEHMENIIDIGTKDKYLRTAAIYGANASGKSNLIFAMSNFQSIISDSMNHVKEGESSVIEALYQPYSFEEKLLPSEYQIVLMLDNDEYRYGFEFNNEEILAEWLYKVSAKTNRQTIILEREKGEINFGASVRSELNKFKDQIPKETLVLSFLSKLPKLKSDYFKRVYVGIMETLVVSSVFGEDYRIIDRFLPSVIDNEKKELLEFLRAIDVGIIDIDYDDSETEIKFTTYHMGRNGNEYPLGLFNESEGTIKSIILFIYARMAIRNNKSIFVDELNIKLHPLLLKFIIDLFYNENSKAQLLYTTHDTTLLDKRFFRRDQIWFIDKDEYGCSNLCSLSDYKVRSDASFEKDYLAGVYGGIPSINNEYDFGIGE